MRTKLLTIVLLVFGIGQVNAQTKDYEVLPLESFLPNYKTKYHIIEKHIDSQTNWTIEQKFEFLTKEVNKLKNDFLTQRKVEYKSKSTELSVYHSCTSKSSGSKKNCGWNYVSAPIKGMTTTENDCRVVGKSKGIAVVNNGTSAGIKMSVAGKGKNAGTLYAIFRYNDEFISQQIHIEEIELFNRIIEK